MSAQSMQSFEIDKRRIGAGHPCLIIAEVALTHDGSLGTAHAFIDAIARAGASCVKFQTHIASAESTPSESFRIPFSRQDASRYAYWERTAFTPEQWSGLASHAREAGLIFLSSPFSLEALQLLESLGVPAWKIGSGEVSNDVLVERAASTGKPVLLSSGLSTLSELDRAAALVRRAGAPLAVFQCTSAYPCPPERLGLEQITLLQQRYACPAGLSDHSGAIYAGIAAATLGANLVEVHVTLSREAFGPDVVASVTTQELAQLVQGIRFVERALAAPVDKDAPDRSVSDLRALFTKSVTVREPLPEGAVLGAQHLTVKKPGTGIPAAQLSTLVGRRLKRAVQPDTILSLDDLE